MQIFHKRDRNLPTEPEKIKLTESLSLRWPSEEDVKNLQNAYLKPHKYVIGLVIIPRDFNPPTSLVFDDQGCAEISIKVIEEFSYPEYDRYHILNKLVRQMPEFGFESYRALRESIYSKRPALGLPLLGAYRLKKSGEIVTLDLKRNVEDKSENQLIAKVTPLQLYFLLSFAFKDCYTTHFPSATRMAQDAVENLKKQIAFKIGEPLVTNGLDTVHPLIDKGFVLTKHTIVPNEAGLTGAFRYDRAGSKPLFCTDRRIHFHGVGANRNYRWCQFDEHSTRLGVKPVTVDIFYTLDGVHKVKVFQVSKDGQSFGLVEELEFREPRQKPIKFFWDPLSEIYYQLGLWTARQLRQLIDCNE